MHQEEQLSGEESLKLINKMIHQAKGYFHESGLGALVYGFTGLLCSVLAYLHAVDVIVFPFNPYFLMVPVFFIQSIIQYKEDRRKAAKTFTDEAIDYVWLGFFIAVLAVMCAAFAGIDYMRMSFVIILAGLASFLTGMLAKFRYMVIAGFVCWAIGIVSFFQQNPSIYLLVAVVTILIWIVPGFILLNHFKKTVACTTTKSL